jgi:four helix bundle protein
MAHSIICTRAFDFGVRILNFAEKLWERGPAARHIAGQLMGCGTSIGANAEEAQDGQTKADFIAKLSVSRKEARETAFWIRMAIAKGATTRAEIESELQEVGELRAMIVAAIRTARASSARGGDSQL